MILYDCIIMLIKRLKRRKLLKLCSALPPSEIERMRQKEKEALEKELLNQKREAISERTYKEIVDKLLQSLDHSIERYSQLQEALESQRDTNPEYRNIRQYFWGILGAYEGIKKELLSDLKVAQEKENNRKSKEDE